ncbi:MAG: MarR family transcriptional regulator [Candidatus Geothermarchaeales archaeon]
MSSQLEPLTKSEHRLLAFLKERSLGEFVYTVDMKQAELAKKLGISRQALSVKLRPLIERGYVRTGRGFVVLTEKSMSALGYYGKPAYILVKIEPRRRKEVYRTLKLAEINKISRVAGDADLILEVDGTEAARVLNRISTFEGVVETKTYFTLKMIS